MYIENFSTNNDYIVVRPVEWIIPEDEKRIKELDLDVERDLVSGYYIKDWGFSEMKIPHHREYGISFHRLLARLFGITKAGALYHYKRGRSIHKLLGKVYFYDA